MARKLRSITRDVSYENDCKAICSDIKELEDVERALDWFIIRADYFEENEVMSVSIPGTDVLVVRLDASRALPPLRAFYRLPDADSALLIALEKIPEEEQA